MSLNTMRVLYVDDMKELRDLMTLVLTRDGHTIETAASAKAALAILAATPDAFDLVITDHHMDEINGLDFVKHLRRLRYKGKTVVFSSELAPTVNEAYGDLGVDRILQKPVAPSVLRKLLAELMTS